jgi:hypothetical protein
MTSKIYKMSIKEGAKEGNIKTTIEETDKEGNPLYQHPSAKI